MLEGVPMLPQSSFVQQGANQAQQTAFLVPPSDHRPTLPLALKKGANGC